MNIFLKRMGIMCVQWYILCVVCIVMLYQMGTTFATDNHSICDRELESYTGLIGIDDTQARQCLAVWLKDKRIVDISKSPNLSIGVLSQALTNIYTDIEMTLHLENNNFPVIEEDVFGSLEKVKQIEMRQNRVAEMASGAFTGLQYLQYLYLDYNELTRIERRTFVNLSSLQTVDLQFNEIEYIENEAFYNVSNLKNLYLYGNRLVSLSGKAFYMLASLNALDVGNNKIADIDVAMFQKLQHVEKLRIDVNKLSTLPDIASLAFTSAEIITFHKNPWTCDCSLRWMISLVQNTSWYNSTRPKTDQIPDPFPLPRCNQPQNVSMDRYDTSYCDHIPFDRFGVLKIVLPLGCLTIIVIAASVAFALFVQKHRSSNQTLLARIRTFRGVRRMTLSDIYNTCSTTLSGIPDTMDEKTVLMEGESLYRHVVLGNLVGTGEFGVVHEATVTIWNNKKVAVKKHRPTTDTEATIKELTNMQQYGKHPNIVQVFESCIIDGSPVIIMELADKGDLRAYLQRVDRDTLDVRCDLDPDLVITFIQDHVPVLYSFMWQIARGMEYLAQMKIVHRDLAARNILIFDGDVAKVSDFGLSRDVYETGLYVKQSAEALPYKWLSPENWREGRFTSKSDVWAYGVLLWEIMTLGCTPYPGIPPAGLGSMLLSGYTMDRPSLCPLEIYAIMRNCWHLDPSDRPCFQTLVEETDAFLQSTSGKEYIDVV